MAVALESLQLAASACKARGLDVAEGMLRASWEGRRVYDMGYTILLVRVRPDWVLTSLTNMLTPLGL